MTLYHAVLTKGPAHEHDREHQYVSLWIAELHAGKLARQKGVDWVPEVWDEKDVPVSRRINRKWCAL